MSTLKPVLIGLAWVAGLYALACLALYLLQRHLMYFPQPAAIKAPAMLALKHADEPGVEIAVSAVPRESPQALIYLGGNAEDVSLNLPAFSAAMPGHALYLMHYRGYGASGGRPGEHELVRDALALHDWARSRHAQVTLVGRSLGSGIAVQVAAQRPVHRLVLVTPYDSVERVASDAYPIFPVRWLIRDRYDSWQHAPLVSAPVTVIAATHDQVIAPERTRELLPRFKPGQLTVHWVEGAGHDSVSGDPRYLQWLVGQEAQAR